VSALSITLTTALLLASHGVDVRSSTNCPASQDIAERLRPLLPDEAGQGAAHDLATVDVTELDGPHTTLRIRLVRAHGAEVGDRRILMQGDCSEAAATIAAVIAAWETEPLRPIAPAAAVATTPPASPPPTSSTWLALVGVGGGVGLVGGVAGVARIEAVAGQATSHLRGRIGIAGETMRTVSLYSGSVDWRHTTFEASVLLRTLHPTWSLSVDAGLALGWATLEGRGFAPNRGQSSFEYGGVEALRLARSLGRWSAWVEARAYNWLRGQRASLAGEQVSADLPRFDVTTCVGLSAPLF
jgi:hypothetical protein